ncbi:Cysteine-rich RLK (RECEPTOR-like protein kinase) 8 [Theobroma cacao]|uniref:Cysteine-rich RLK (RECEPTOR-like protein kinase) 8 n=1 Tax=Theobroma cacao TaxID=3641 RepID=A0A061FU15_THECC|nr:Cysteine-rich RLK (RECEPTOR-like protein kinase) 8 [Theobroma cacao]
MLSPFTSTKTLLKSPFFAERCIKGENKRLKAKGFEGKELYIPIHTKDEEETEDAIEAKVKETKIAGSNTTLRLVIQTIPKKKEEEEVEEVIDQSWLTNLTLSAINAIDLPSNPKTIGVKWVYKTKLKKNGEVDKYKARLVAKGYKQKYDIDYKEVFAVVSRLDTIRLVFINQPPGYVKSVIEHKLYKLKKTLYGLKQAPRAWNSHIDAYFHKEGFQRYLYEHTLYIKIEDGGKMLMVCVNVDDLIYTGNDSVMIHVFKRNMMIEFDMSNLGLMHYFLGIEVMQSPISIFISQNKYVLEILDRFKMKDYNLVCTQIEYGLKLMKDDGGKKINATFYKQIVGSLMYLTSTRPDIIKDQVADIMTKLLKQDVFVKLQRMLGVFFSKDVVQGKA